MTHRPGGGPSSRQVISKPVRTGAPRQGVRPAGVAQIGSAIGNHTMREGNIGYRGERVFSGLAFQSKLGNEIAGNVGKGSPGAGRTLYGQSGSQGTHGATNPGDQRPNAQRHPLGNK